MSPTDHRSTHLLGAEGPFAETLDGFAPREAQIRMAEAVEDLLREGGALVAEAPASARPWPTWFPPC